MTVCVMCDVVCGGGSEGVMLSVPSLSLASLCLGSSKSGFGGAGGI